MRFSNVMLGVFGVGLIGAASLAGCGGGSGNTGGDGGGGTTTNSNTTTTTGGTCTDPCCPAASCKAVDKECIGLVDNAGQAKFGLRMSELTVDKPGALSTGIVATIVGGAVALSSPECNLSGSGTFSWLLEFDTAAGKLKTGGAKPVADPASGFSFVDEMLGGKQVSPITFDVTPDASGNFSVTTGQDIVVPIFLDAAATQYVLLPLKQAKLTMGTLSASQNCIGHYNSEGLDPLNVCLPDDQNKAFVAGASLGGLITLEDADTVEIASLNETLCVLLANNMGVAGPNGIKVCERDAGNKITFQGDACEAGGACGDSVALSAKFAASSVKIN